MPLNLPGSQGCLSCPPLVGNDGRKSVLVSDDDTASTSMSVGSDRSDASASSQRDPSDIAFELLHNSESNSSLFLGLDEAVDNRIVNLLYLELNQLCHDDVHAVIRYLQSKHSYASVVDALIALWNARGRREVALLHLKERFEQLINVWPDEEPLAHARRSAIRELNSVATSGGISRDVMIRIQQIMSPKHTQRVAVVIDEVVDSNSLDFLQNTSASHGAYTQFLLVAEHISSVVFSLKKSGRLEYISLAFAQSSDATNGCGVIQPVVALEHTILGGDLILEDTVSVATQHLNEIRGAGDQRFVGLFETTDCLSKLGRYKDVNFGGYLVGDLSCNDFMNNMLSSIPSAVHCGFVVLFRRHVISVLVSPGIDGQPTFTIVETAASPSYGGNGFEIRCKDAFSLVFALRDFLFTGIKNNPSDLNMVNSSPSVSHGVDRRTDEYHPMSTQFLLFVPDNKKHGEPSLTTENPPLAAPIEADASNLLVEDSNAITIERWYRGCMGRARWWRLRGAQASLLLTNNFRMQINRRKYNRARLGTVRLQSQYRGNAVRKVNAATKIQSVERMHVQNSAYRKLKSATIALQCCARRGKAKKIFDQVVSVQSGREEVPPASREDERVSPDDVTCERGFDSELQANDFQMPELQANDSAETLQDITNPARAHVGSIEPCPDEENLGSEVPNTDIVIYDETMVLAENATTTNVDASSSIAAVAATASKSRSTSKTNANQSSKDNKRKSQPKKKKKGGQKQKKPRKSKEKSTKAGDSDKPNKSDKLGDNETYTTIKVGLGSNCNNVGMRGLMDEMSLFVSKASNLAGEAMNLLIVKLFSSDDERLKQDIENFLATCNPTKDTFSYRCMNKYPSTQNALIPLVQEAFDACTFPQLDHEGQAALLNAAARTMSTNIVEKLKNWSIYQKLAVRSQVIEAFNLDSKNRRHKKKINRLVAILVQMINGTQPKEELNKAEDRKGSPIVKEHRMVLRLDPYSLIHAQWAKYQNTRKKKRKGGNTRYVKTKMPQEDGLSDKFATSNPVTTLKYFAFCLDKQMGDDGYRKFNILNNWKSQHGYAEFGNKCLLVFIREHGTAHDRQLVQGYRLNTMNKHPHLRQLWLNYFPSISRLERSNPKQKMTFNNLIRSDGIGLDLIFKRSYLDDDHTCERIKKTPPLRSLPAEETERCQEIVSFGKYRDETQRYVLKNDPQYCDWVLRTANEGSASSHATGLLSLAEYLVDDTPQQLPAPQVFNENHNPFGFKKIEAWWNADARINDADNIYFTTSRQTKIKLSSLRGQFMWSFDPGNTNILSGNLYYLDHQYNLYEAFSKRIEWKNLDYYEKSHHNLRQTKEALWMRPFAPLFEDMSRHSTKTTSIQQFLGNLEIYANSYGQLWVEKHKRRHRRIDFDVHMCKTRYLDKMVNELYHPFLDGQNPPIVLMGSAKIRPGIRGTKSAPCEFVQRKIRERAIVLYCCENRTSILCALCGALTKIVSRHGSNGYPDDSRGLLYCTGRLCRREMTQLQNRDVNGGRCIIIKKLFEPARYNVAGNFTALRGRHFINHADGDVEIDNRISGLEAQMERAFLRERASRRANSSTENADEDDFMSLDDTSHNDDMSISSEERSDNRKRGRSQEDSSAPALDDLANRRENAHALAVTAYRSINDLESNFRAAFQAVHIVEPARGLPNPLGHNYCYLNVVVQLLYHLPITRDAIMSGRFMNNIGVDNQVGRLTGPEGGAVLLSLSRLFRQMYDRENDISVADFKESYLTVSSQFDGFGQHDADEFLLAIMNIIIDLDSGHHRYKDASSILELALWKAKMNESSQPREQSRNECGAEIIIPNVLPFLGGGGIDFELCAIEKRTLTCLQCKYTRTNEADVTKLTSLAFPPNVTGREDVTTLGACIAHNFNNVEIMRNDVFCGDGDIRMLREEDDIALGGDDSWVTFEWTGDVTEGGCQRYPPETEVRITMPIRPIMFMRLNRFQYDTQSNAGIKIESKVEIPLHGLQIGGHSYSLFGVIKHYGGYGTGHYVLNVLVGEKFYEFNDMRVRAIDASDFIDDDLCRAAYVLVYYRDDMKDELLSSQFGEKHSSRKSGAVQNKHVIAQITQSSTSSSLRDTPVQEHNSLAQKKSKKQKRAEAARLNDESDEEIVLDTLAARENALAIAAAAAGRAKTVSCDCKGGCSYNSCPCLKVNKKCTADCHQNKSRDCKCSNPLNNALKGVSTIQSFFAPSVQSSAKAGGSKSSVGQKKSQKEKVAKRNTNKKASKHKSCTRRLSPTEHDKLSKIVKAVQATGLDWEALAERTGFSVRECKNLWKLLSEKAQDTVQGLILERSHEQIERWIVNGCVLNVIAARMKVTVKSLKSYIRGLTKEEKDKLKELLDDDVDYDSNIDDLLE